MEKCRILVVEDEAVTAMDLKVSLTQLGHTVVGSVGRAEDAIRLAHELNPDLVLMDIQLSGPVTGLVAAREIREAHSTPIIFLSAHTDPETLGEARITEPFAFLPKPCNRDALAISIEMALYKSKMEAERSRMVEELRKSEEKFRTVADFTADWEFWVGEDGKLLYISPSCLEISGYSVEDFTSDPDLLSRIVHPDDREMFKGHIYEANREEKAMQEVEFRIIHRDGFVRWISHNCRPVFSPEGKFLGTRGSNRDMSLRKEGDLERERLIMELNAALASVKVLKGLIPVCAWCRKVRDDKGFWQGLENYIASHSDADFTHGICPECEIKSRKS